MIYVSDKKAILCKGDFRPAQFYKGKKKIAGYVTETFEGVERVTLANCYNDRLHKTKIYGNDGNVGDLVTEGEHSGKYKIGVVVRGKNLWKGENYLIPDSNTAAMMRYVYANSNTWVKHGATITVSATVCIKDNRTNPRMSIDTQFTDGTTLNAQRLNYTGNGNEQRMSLTYTIPQSDVAIQRLLIRFADYSSRPSDGVYDAYAKDIQIESGDTATELDEFKEPQTFNIFLDEPLYDGEYIDFENGKVVRGSDEETILLPDIPTTRGTTVCEINTNISARISGEYKKVIK